jgi:hypothetical protein
MASSIRQRVTKPTEGPATESATPASRLHDEDKTSFFSIFEILRTLTLIFVLSSTLSWFITKDGIWWGYKPKVTSLDYWQELLVRVTRPIDVYNELY